MLMKSQQFYFFKRKSYLSFLNENPSNSYILFIKAYIYIYIYRERERERELGIKAIIVPNGYLLFATND